MSDDLKEMTPNRNVLDEVTLQDLLGAIQDLESGISHPFGPSTRYDVLYNGKRYPPKAVVGLAARRILGRILRPDEFTGGRGSRCFAALERNGFKLVPKEGSSSDDSFPAEPPGSVWIEFTKTSHKHGGSGWEFSTCLWSPTRNKIGRDIYALMREVKQGDLVIHVNDGVLAGWSYASGPAQEITVEPPSPGDWGGRGSYYRIDLGGYVGFEEPIRLADFIDAHEEAIRDEIASDNPSHYPFIVYAGTDVRTAQGMYLSVCTPRLFELFREHFGTQRSEEGTKRYWVMSPGQGGRLWDEFQEQRFIAVGWDDYDLGDLSQYTNVNALRYVTQSADFLRRP